MGWAEGLPVEDDLSGSDDVDPLQIEARQRHADHAVGQHEAGPRFGQTQRARHPVGAGHREKKLRAAQIERVQVDLAAQQSAPVERHGRAVHRDFGIFGEVFRTQADFVEDQPFERTEPHAVELQLQSRPCCRVDQRRVESLRQSGEVQPEQGARHDHQKKDLRNPQQRLEGVVGENPPRHAASKVTAPGALVRRGA